MPEGFVRRRDRPAAIHARQHPRLRVDFDGDGRVDLCDDPDDAIGSVAHYLPGHGWQRGQPVMEPARIDAEDPEQGSCAASTAGITERRALADWVRDGVTGFAIPGDLAPDPVGLLMLEERRRAAATGWSSTTGTC